MPPRIKFNICECHCRIKRDFLIYQRHILVLLLMCGVSNMYGMKFSLGDAMMYLHPKNETSRYKGEAENAMNWSTSELISIKRCFLIGYVVGHLPSGILCDLYGGRPFLLTGMTMGTIATFATPSIILYCPWWAMVVRNLFLGLGLGMNIPACYNLMSHWIPSTTLTVGSSIGYSAGTIGNLLSQVIARRFIEDLSTWTWVFYTWGILSLVWLVLGCCYIFSHPVSHPFVSEEEREAMREEMGVVYPNKIPIVSILTDSGMWALLVGHFGHSWTLYICVTGLREYIVDTLKVDIVRPAEAIYPIHLFYWANTCACGFLVNYIIRKEFMTTQNARALFCAIGIILPNIVALILTYSGDNPKVIIALVVLTLFSKGPINASLKANIFDVTRHYVGTITAITSGIGAVTTVLSLDIVKNTAPDNTEQEWRKVTWMSFAISCYSYLIFFIWIKSTAAHWDFEKKTDRTLHFTDEEVVTSRRL